MRPLPRNHLSVVLSWQVCEEYRDYKKAVEIIGKETVDALDVINMPEPFRPVDKVWALLRKESLPQEILDVVLRRIVADLPHDTDPEKRSKIEHCCKVGDYWRAALHTLQVISEEKKLRSIQDEQMRQFLITREEIEKWVLSGSPS